MKTVLLEIEDSKFEQVMTIINSLKSDLIKKFEVQPKEDNSLMESELLEDLELYKMGKLETIEIGDIDGYIAELKREIA
ncbi:MAG: hypothetical protein M0P91_01095 [Sulfuricurvum sp.]|jgi:hypothetical protein|uniref:hypothetical protein n=1 Tax=Sulfuricurvum sp. TaxID=2025608 RepID=UPI0025D3272E|nr:hypothetical protein [Sulfuricurvum sp.]MCK9371765.1 hypothetical protein [Sulfuricurvum sp.]